MTEYDHTVYEADVALTEYIEQRRGSYDTDDRYQRGYQRGLLMARAIIRDPEHLPTEGDDA